MIDRRGFLGVLAGAVLDPERLLWVPGRKLISVPAVVAARDIPFQERNPLQFFVGDLITFGDERRTFRVTSVHPSPDVLIQYEAVTLPPGRDFEVGCITSRAPRGYVSWSFPGLQRA